MPMRERSFLRLLDRRNVGMCFSLRGLVVITGLGVFLNDDGWFGKDFVLLEGGKETADEDDVADTGRWFRKGTDPLRLFTPYMACLVNGRSA